MTNQDEIRRVLSMQATPKTFNHAWAGSLVQLPDNLATLPTDILVFGELQDDKGSLSDREVQGKCVVRTEQGNRQVKFFAATLRWDLRRAKSIVTKPVQGETP